ncbi:MAG TPA: hypothetical protein VMX18_00280 [Candidatus Bipolaricaulota bacterium]|nr:hypothetical protein [Candidatus Bipolaricaulota bacterium]
MKKTAILLIAALFVFGSAHGVVAENYDFVSSNIWVSETAPLEGDILKISSVVINDGDRRFNGDLVFLDNDQLISSQIAFSLGAGESSKVLTTSWTAVRGEHRFKAEIRDAYFINEEGLNEAIDGTFFSQVTDVIYVDVDSDADGLPDLEEEEQGTDPTNPDTDGDTENDGDDPNPTNPQVFNGPDTDGDGIIDTLDTDIDNDGLYNWDEDDSGTDPKEYDTDGDGYSDKEDSFPLDSKKWKEEVKVAVVEKKDDSKSDDKETKKVKDALADDSDLASSDQVFDSVSDFFANQKNNDKNVENTEAENSGDASNFDKAGKGYLASLTKRDNLLKLALIPLILMSAIIARQLVRKPKSKNKDNDQV